MPTKKKSKIESTKPSNGRRAKKEIEEDENEEDSDDVSDEEQDETDDEDRGRGKRKRRESKSYEPDDFTMSQSTNAIKTATVIDGRGKKLEEIDAAKNCMKKFKQNSEEFSFAYKFLFSNRGIANKKLMKDKLYSFSGYLPALPKGKYNRQKLDDEDEVIETKYAIKAFKMNMSQIKMLCTFFNVDNLDEDSKFLNKEDMIDRLLDFLGAPDESLVKGKESSDTKKKPAAKPKKVETSRSSVAKKVIENPFSAIKDYKKGKVPSDDAMRLWVKAYIVCQDMETATTKDAVRTASAKFGIDMTAHKSRIKELLAEEL